MIALKMIMCVLVLLVAPTLVGFGFLTFTKMDTRGVSQSLLYGTILMWGLFSLICIPMIIFEIPFHVLKWSYSAILVFLCLVVMLTCTNFVRTLIKSARSFWRGRTVWTMVVLILMMLLILGQIVLQHPDADDSEFVAIASTTVHTDSILQYDGMTGNEAMETVMKRLLAPFSILLAYYADVSGFHPAVFCHTVYPVFMIVILFAAYFAIGVHWCREDREKTDLFVLFVGVCMLAGGYSSFSLGARVLFRIWQGKSVLMALAMPAVFVQLSRMVEEKITLKKWLGMLALIFGCTLTSSMADILLPILIGCFAVVTLFKNKSILQAIAMVSTCAPCLVFVVLYVLG